MTWTAFAILAMFGNEDQIHKVSDPQHGFFRAWHLFHLLADWLLTRRVGGTSSPWQVGWCWLVAPGGKAGVPICILLRDIPSWDLFLGPEINVKVNLVPTSRKNWEILHVRRWQIGKGSIIWSHKFCPVKKTTNISGKIPYPPSKAKYCKMSFPHLIQGSEKGKHF